MTDTETVEPDTDDVETSTDTDDTAGTAADVWKPPTEAEWKSSQEKLKKANAQAASHRKAAEEAARKGETEADTRIREATEKASGDAEQRWKPLYVGQAARAELAEQGLIGKADRLLKLLDHERVEVAEDGTVDGLSDQIRELKRDYPELFAKKGSGRIDGPERPGDQSDGGNRRSKATEKLLNQWRSV